MKDRDVEMHTNHTELLKDPVIIRKGLPDRPKSNQSLNYHLSYHPINKPWPSFNLTSIYMGRKAIA